MKESETAPEHEPTPIYDQLLAEQEQAVAQKYEHRLNLEVVGPLARADVEAGLADHIVADCVRRRAEAKRIRESYHPLFPPRRIPSFTNLAGPKAAAEYYDERKSLEDQVTQRASARRRRQL